MADERKLTKREKKALLFKSGKGKKPLEAVEAPDVPEQDDVVEEKTSAKLNDKKLALPPKTRGKKRKRDSEATETVTPAATNDVEQTTGKPSAAKKPKKAVEQPEPPRKRPLFVGNLPYNVTADMIRQHFASCGQTPAVRLLTPKAIPGERQQPARSKGCAFVEFTDAAAIQAALKLHESTLGGRKINVELSAGGGGNSETRKKKIEEKNKRLNQEREKTKLNKKSKKDQNADGGDAQESGQQEPEEPLKTRVRTMVVNGKEKKVRDRRKPKVDQQGNEKVRKRKIEAKSRVFTGANAIRLG